MDTSRAYVSTLSLAMGMLGLFRRCGVATFWVPRGFFRSDPQNEAVHFSPNVEPFFFSPPFSVFPLPSSGIGVF